jgi:nitric oxide reductase activation protein
MSNDMNTAKEAAAAIGVALEGIPGVNPAISSFECTTKAVIRHGEGVRRNVDKIAAMYAGGGTNLGAALWHATESLLAVRDIQRKLVIIITDGEPHERQQCRNLVELMNASGIETFAIGIRSQSVKGLVDEYEVINDIEELKAALFAYAKRAL